MNPRSIRDKHETTSLVRPPRSLCILIADHSVDAAEALGGLCEAKGHEVDFAYDGAAALEAARRLKPDAVFLELDLPGIDGFEIARQLRRDPAFRETLIVGLTASFGTDEVRRAREAGIDEQLLKPPDPELVETLLGRLR
jgi:CheY-like chemotaxis protein